MAHDSKTPIVPVGMIIAAIYAIMLIGLTRSSYFVGGAAFERAGQATFALASSRSVPAPVPARTACAASELKAEDATTSCAATGRPLRLCVQ